jgi:solute carrier family 25 S-adenosylmethionine transporter 26
MTGSGITSSIEGDIIPSITSTYTDWAQELQKQGRRRQQRQTQTRRTEVPGTTAARIVEPAIWKLALAGSLATLVSDVSMHPLDCIKTLQQTEEGMGLSMVAAAHVIWTHLGGPSGFFRGMLTWGVCDAVGGALKFSTYESLKRSVVRWQDRPSSAEGEQLVALSSSPELAKTILFALAGISFVVSSVITVPGELLKQHLQMGHYMGCLDALGSILDAEGLPGLYSGYDGVLLRDVPYTAMELGLYDLFKGLYVTSQRQQSDEQDESLQTAERMMIAGLTGGIAGLLTTPLDTVKTKLMVDMDFAGMSFWDAACTTIENHGPEALFCGALARVAWLVPVTAIYLPTYDFIKNNLSSEGKKVEAPSTS